ncbi:hypothetical protein DSO57_1021733 [Entomophthora muscae]|uniref:Uncharacterized protein n=1 Tax=Entomophthora muscae TaxID=34485 RepID=A0ACC2RI20_9FUNG|nr:hypothetical protein DSO57_1021733 [Entomophthora muscae]
MKFTEAPSLLPLGNLRGSSLRATMVKLVQVFWLWDLAGASACRGSIPKKFGRVGPWSMGSAARRNVGSGFESHPWARVSRRNESSILTLPEYQIGDLVLYYQNCTGGRAHKLDSLWVGPCEVIFKKGVEYTVKPLSSGRPFARVHSKFLHKYQLPVSNLEGGDVVNCAINAILIWPSNIDSCKDLAGLAFKFGNSLPSANGSGSISTHSRLLYLSVIYPGMTSS